MKETYKRRKKNGGDYKNYKKMLPQRIYKRVAVMKREVTKEKRSVSEIIKEKFCDQKRLNGTLRAKKKSS